MSEEQKAEAAEEQKQKKAKKAEATEGTKAPSFQVLRGKAIRVATKDTAARLEVAPKEVTVLDTHKTGGSGEDKAWTFDVLTEAKNKRFRVSVEIPLDGKEPKATAAEAVSKDVENAKA